MKRTIADNQDPIEQVGYDFGLKRRSFVQLLGAGLIFTAGIPALAQRAGKRGPGGGGAKTILARIHIGENGRITLLSGKVEAGQGARAELAEAAAEELRVSTEIVDVILADTAVVPDDGITAGSGTSPRTVPSVRQGAAAARQALIALAARSWSVEADSCQARDAGVYHTASDRKVTYKELATNPELAKSLEQSVGTEITLIPVKEWKVLGKPLLRPNGRAIVTGAHQYPSDIRRPGMLYAKVLRAPTFNTSLVSVDLEAAKQSKDVVVVRDGQFVGVAAPTTFAAEAALTVLAKSAKWDFSGQVASKDLAEHLQQHVQGGMPKNPFSEDLGGNVPVARQTYYIPYAQHAPLEPRAAVAEWEGEKLTVWTGSQNPFGVRSELARAFHLSDADVRVVVPDFGAGFGGKHSGEAAVEAARIAKAAGKPVSLRWTREEEFTWAYFRPAGVMLAEASLDPNKRLATWHFVNANSGGAGVETPYEVPKHRSTSVNSAPPLRHGSYRALAATANHFARESFMDELAVLAGSDPLAFRLDHLKNPRLRAVLEAATNKFKWTDAYSKKSPNRGIGLACGTEKRSFVAACVELELSDNKIRVVRVCEAFECGAILNPTNLRNQVEGAIIMGLGPALREEMRFEKGEMINASFSGYQVPRIEDVPEMEIVLVNRSDLPSEGAGETPIIPIAPAIANAVFNATGKRIREMPIRLPA